MYVFIFYFSLSPIFDKTSLAVIVNTLETALSKVVDFLSSSHEPFIKQYNEYVTPVAKVAATIDLANKCSFKYLTMLLFFSFFYLFLRIIYDIKNTETYIIIAICYLFFGKTNTNPFLTSPVFKSLVSPIFI